MTAIDKKNINLFYLVSLLFIFIELYFVYKQNYLFSLFPLVVLVVMFAIFAMDKLLLLIVFFVPFSVQLKDITSTNKLDMSLPTEPLIFGIMLIFFIKLALERSFDKKILKHPISIAIYIHLAWTLVTCFTSTMPGVSFKFFLSKLWFIIVFYFVATQLFKDKKKIDLYIWLYSIALLAIVYYSLTRLSSYGFFNQKAAHSMMRPFYNDHTSYAAILAMLLPVLVGFAISKRYNTVKKVIIGVFVGVFVLAIIFSYTRASWLSLVLALIFWILMRFKVKMRTIYTLVLIAGGVFFVFQDSILEKMEKNRQDSSTNISEHIQSISNVSSDASNVERINRWNCAFRMFEQKPVFGWGPGTYMFKYAPFQKAEEKTIISTNAGDRGNAHSEYIGPLAESGVLGTVTFLIIIIVTLNTGVTKLYRNSKSGEHRLLVISLILGLVTYYIHGALNNFLDTDKACALFWGFMAMIVAIDVYHERNKESEAVTETTNTDSLEKES